MHMKTEEKELWGKGQLFTPFRAYLVSTEVMGYDSLFDTVYTVQWFTFSHINSQKVFWKSHSITWIQFLDLWNKIRKVANPCPTFGLAQSAYYNGFFQHQLLLQQRLPKMGVATFNVTKLLQKVAIVSYILLLNTETYLGYFHYLCRIQSIMYVYPLQSQCISIK